jgi:hypothetical protein
MTKAIAYDRIFVNSLWMVEEEYTKNPKRPIYNSYGGWQMEMVETMGAMVSVIDTPYHQ